MKKSRQKKETVDPRFQRVIDTICEAIKRKEHGGVIKSLLEAVDWDDVDPLSVHHMFRALFAIGIDREGMDDERNHHGQRERLRNALAHRARVEHSYNCECCAAEMQREEAAAIRKATTRRAA